MEEARAQGEPPIPGRGRLTACGCPGKKIAVRADGVIVPCTMLAHIELGRINRDSLAEVWRAQSGHEPASEPARHPADRFRILRRLLLYPVLHRKLPWIGLHVDRPGGSSQSGCLFAALPCGGRTIV